MKPIAGIHFAQISRKIIRLITLAFFSSNCFAQDLDINQTLNYLNKKAQEFPYQNDHLIFYYTFSLTPNGELKIEEKNYFKNPFEPGKTELTSITIYKMGIDKIAVNESFQSNRYNETEYIIYVYPNENGFFYKEKTNNTGVQEYKKTVPYQHGQSLDNYFISKNYISIYLGDAGNKSRIKNALMHLYTLVISEPIKFGLNTESDPFASPQETKKTGLSSENTSNTIKILKTQSGLIEVPIVINDVLRINFIFDSGASEVSLSPDVALTLIRTGTISENDWLQDQIYTFADGSKAKSKRFLIKKLIIGNQVLTNIEASISSSIEAPMLIGQNVMQKLGSVTIDYNNLLLIIKSK
jgi:predicted aspartyl protease